jgi:hypothetical protein
MVGRAGRGRRFPPPAIPAELSGRGVSPRGARGDPGDLLERLAHDRPAPGASGAALPAAPPAGRRWPARRSWEIAGSAAHACAADRRRGHPPGAGRQEERRRGAGEVGAAGEGGRPPKPAAEVAARVATPRPAVGARRPRRGRPAERKRVADEGGCPRPDPGSVAVAPPELGRPRRGRREPPTGSDLPDLRWPSGPEPRGEKGGGRIGPARRSSAGPEGGWQPYLPLVPPPYSPPRRFIWRPSAWRRPTSSCRTSSYPCRTVPSAPVRIRRACRSAR